MNFKKDLVENILPFWLKNSIDYENGGIYTCVDREGNIYGTDKINDSVKYAKDLKDRFTVLWLNYQLLGGKY